MMSAIAERYLYPCTCPCFTPNDERTDIILRRIEEYNVDGLVYHILKGCHLNNLEYARLKMVLARKNIPVLRLESEYDMGDVGQLKIRVEAFLEMILTGSEVGI
jgi:benzoyl-CoA reductase/2-hydroxyglutaryl-CoA dehydratase subunit BcrC/BadD/HgdB